MFSKVEFSTFYLGVLFIIQNGKKNQQSEALAEFIYFEACQHVANILHCFLLDFWFNKSLFSICPNRHFLFYFTTTFFSLSVLFFSFISTVFMLQPGYNRVSKPIKSQMKVKYANINNNHFKMFAGRIKTQQFLWRKKKGWSVPAAKLIHHRFFCRESGFYSATFSRTCRLETVIALISSLSLSCPSFFTAHITVHDWLPCLRPRKSTFITLCPPLGVASVVTIRIIWGGTSGHCSLFWEFTQE